MSHLKSYLHSQNVICVFLCLALLFSLLIPLAHSSKPEESWAKSAAITTISVQEREQERQLTAQEKELGIFPRSLPLPDFPKDVKWLNTGGPIRKKDLRGKFVVIDFWTYCCINCIHVLPELKKLEKKYPNEVVVIGCHSAKFEAEQDTKNITQAIMRYEIEHPVFNDTGMRYWRRIGARSWPTIIIAGPDGRVFWGRGGETTFETLEKVILSQMEKFKENKMLDTTPLRFELASQNVKPTPLRFPGKILTDEKSNRLYISDSNHNRIVVTTLDGKLVTTIGSGRIGKRDGSYRTAQFDHPQGMALVDSMLYVADTENHLIRKVDLQKRRVTTVAGTGVQARRNFQVYDKSTAGPTRWSSKKIKSVALNSPWALTVHDKKLIIAMAGNHQIWQMPLDESSIGPLAGNGREDIVDGPFLPSEPYKLDAASFAQPSGFTTDDKFLYLADSEGSSIRKIPLSGKGEVSTLVGTADRSMNRLFTFGDQDGPAEKVLLQHPLGVAHRNGIIYVADTYNNKIKAINAKTGQTNTISGTGKPGNADEPAQYDEPSGLAIANNKLYVADTNNHAIRVIDLDSKKVSTLKIPRLRPIVKFTDDLPIFRNAVDIPFSRTLVAKPGKLKVTVKPRFPDNWKINERGPAIFLSVVKTKSTPNRPIIKSGKSTVDKNSYQLEVDVPKDGTQLEISLRYFYCQAGGEGICKVGEARWTIELTPRADGRQDLELLLKVKKP